MDCDDLVIGSGLAALGAVLGLLESHGRNVIVLSGPPDGSFLHYDARGLAPCAFLGAGGLGSHWHGVIPTGLRPRVGDFSDADFCTMFARFYPHANIETRVGTPALFVPWRPVRPWSELRRLAARFGSPRLKLLQEAALSVRVEGQRVQVQTHGGIHSGKRCWVAAGALHTPQLLASTFGQRIARGLASDHVLSYLGQLHGQARPDIQYTRNGLFFPALHDMENRALYTLRPARFDFRRLDAGFERRQVFGLPTGALLTKLAGRLSPGLLTEVLFNRLGVLGAAKCHSVYAQILVRDAYTLAAGALPLLAQADRIRAATDAVRTAQPYAGLKRSRCPALYLPGIHLHHTLDASVLAAEGLSDMSNPIQIVDASALTDIGAEHHSFKMMANAFARARSTLSVGGDR